VSASQARPTCAEGVSCRLRAHCTVSHGDGQRFAGRGRPAGKALGLGKRLAGGLAGCPWTGLPGDLDAMRAKSGKVAGRSCMGARPVLMDDGCRANCGDDGGDDCGAGGRYELYAVEVVRTRYVPTGGLTGQYDGGMRKRRGRRKGRSPLRQPSDRTARGEGAGTDGK
jgi:hypothetical protein